MISFVRATGRAVLKSNSTILESIGWGEVVRELAPAVHIDDGHTAWCLDAQSSAIGAQREEERSKLPLERQECCAAAYNRGGDQHQHTLPRRPLHQVALQQVRLCDRVGEVGGHVGRRSVDSVVSERKVKCQLIDVVATTGGARGRGQRRKSGGEEAARANEVGARGSAGQGSGGEGSVGEGSGGDGSVGKDSAGEGSAGKGSADEDSGGDGSAVEGSANQGSAGEGSADEGSGGDDSSGEGSAGGGSADEGSGGEGSVGKGSADEGRGIGSDPN